MPPGADRQSWNQRYLAGEFQAREPDAFVSRHIRSICCRFCARILRRMPALDLTLPEAMDGMPSGWRMTLADCSEVALEIARNSAGAQTGSLPVKIEQGAALDIVTQLHQQGRRLGLVLVSFFLIAPSCRGSQKSLFPGACFSTAAITRTSAWQSSRPAQSGISIALAGVAGSLSRHKDFALQRNRYR